MIFRKAAVTGGAGFIGSHITESLIKQGTEVVVIDDLSDGALDNVAHNARLQQCDIRDLDALSRALAGVEVVFHHAAIASVPRCSDHPLEAFSVNVHGTMTVAEALRCASPGARIIFASSAAVYGKSLKPMQYGEDSAISPASVYGASKYMAEVGLQSMRTAYGTDVRIVRYANVYGPRQPRYILFDMYRKVKESNGDVEVIGSGQQLRDFIYVDDAVHATIEVAKADVTGANVFNIGTGVATSVLDLTQMICEQMGRPQLQLRPTRESWLGDVDFLLLDPSRVRELSGNCTVALAEGIQKFIDWVGFEDVAAAV